MRLLCAGLIMPVMFLLGCGGSDPAHLNAGDTSLHVGGTGGRPSGLSSSTSFIYVSNSGSNSVSGFSIDPGTGALTQVAGSPFTTPTPAGLARDGTTKYLTVANGNLTGGFPGISVIGIHPHTGALFDLHCVDKEFPGNLPCYPLISNTHGTPRFVAAQQETIYVGNTRSDDVSVFVQDPPNGDLGTNIPSEFSAAVTSLRFLDFVGGKLWAAGDSGIAELQASPGTIALSTSFVLDRSIGYRAAALHGSGKFFYAIDENDAVHIFCFQPSCALGEQNQAPLASLSGASSIVIQDDFAYVTHSNSADVAVYSIDPTDGALALLTSVPAGTGATSARIFLGKLLYVANSGDGTVSGYQIDSKTGLLTPVPSSPFKTGTNPTFIAAP